MADIGYVSLFLALLVGIYAAFAFIIGARKGYPDLIASGRNGMYAVCGLVSLASLALFYAFVSRDFSLEYVASYSSRDMNILYTLSSFWAGNDGSLLFWALVLGISGAIAVAQAQRRQPALMPYVGFVVLVTQIFFLGLMLTSSNPFRRLPVAMPDGRGLNPLLENPGMFLHPPTQLAGYAGFTIPFAFAIAALITGRLGDEWVKSIRRWTLFYWLMLGLGNLAGAQWAYVELGWGGFWAWDPVENAGLMPWLTGTAFLHSVMIQQKRGMLKVWNIVLIIITFVLSIFGTFLTRSGVLNSVHSFGMSSLGPFFIAFMGVTLIASVGLLFWRLEDLKSDNELDSFVSRESSFLLNNLILVASAFAIFLGVMFPLISEAVRGVKVTVGPAFYNQVNGPIFFLLMLIMGFCALIGWRRASLNNLVRNFLYPAIFAVIAMIVLLLFGMRQLVALIGFGICGFVLGSIFLEWARGTRALHRTRKQNYFSAFLSLVSGNTARYGGYIIHVGIILLAIGIIGSTAFSVSKEVSLEPGQTVDINQYSLKYEKTTEFSTQKKQVVAATLSVYNDKEFVGTMTAEKLYHKNYEQPVTEVAIRSNLKEDLYVIFIGWENEGKKAAFKVLVNPLVNWIWLGGGVMLLGTIIAYWPDRREKTWQRAKKESKT